MIERFVLCVIGVIPIAIMVLRLYFEEEYIIIKQKYQKIMKSICRNKEKKMTLVLLFIMLIMFCIICGR